jgi:hypothetical protein
MRVLVAAAISVCLAILAISGIVFIAACIGLMTVRSGSDPEVTRKFSRMLFLSLALIVLSAAAFWWVSSGATVPLFRY